MRNEPSEYRSATDTGYFRSFLKFLKFEITWGTVLLVNFCGALLEIYSNNYLLEFQEKKKQKNVLCCDCHIE